MTDLIQHFINGQLHSGEGKRRGDVFNPASGEKTKQVVFANEADVNTAVAAAKAALPAWSATTPLRRSRILFAFKELFLKHFEELAALLTAEHGKVMSDARGEITRAMEVVEFACGAPHLLRGSFSENVGTHVDCHTVREPVGICVAITPFNFPAMVPMWMLPIAIACGNTFILKPSEKDPSVSMRLIELLKDAGLPDGVVNVVHGDKVAVDALLTHPDVATVSFVGSTPIAQYIYETASKQGKRAQALGGAKNHCIVLPDADMTSAVNGLLGSAYGSAGERCMAISVAVAVGDQVADKLVEEISQRLQTLKVLPGNQEDAEMGPLVTQQHLEKVVSYVALGEKEGANLVVDGRNIKVPGGENGFFLGPCLFDNVTPDMRIYKEEIFGPVLCIVRVPHFDDAVALINNNPYGNGTAIYTNNGAAARNFATRIQVGMVGINVPIPVPLAFHSFGGWKNSLYGDTHMHGPEGFHFYTKMKTITTRWPTTQISHAEYAIPTMK